MKVKEICSREVKSCRSDTNLATAGSVMWQGDCGALPVVDEGGRVIGIITDRDLCIAVATRYRPAAEIAVHEVCRDAVYICSPEDDVRDALAVMREHRVRRLPVTNPDGTLCGLLSIDDMVFASQSNRKGRKNVDLKDAEVVRAFQAICQPELPAVTAEERRFIAGEGI